MASLLDRLAPHVPGHDGQIRRYIFSRAGFRDRLRTFAASDPELELVMPADIYR